MERVLKHSRRSLEYWTEKFQKTQDGYDQQSIIRHTQEINDLIREIASLKKLLNIGEKNTENDGPASASQPGQ